MKSFKPRQVFLAASLAVAFGVFAFACGSNEDVPPTCDGAGCIDGGGSESSTPETSTTDGPVEDSPSDSPSEGGDAGACRLQEAGTGEAGALLSAWNVGTAGYTTPQGIALDPKSADIAVTGEFNGTIDFGGGAFTNGGPTPEAHSAFVARFDKAGTHKWSKAYPAGAFAQAGPIAIDGSGNVVVAGSFQGTIDLGGGPVTAIGDADIFLVSLTAGGAYRWSKTFGTAANSNNSVSVGVDGASNVVLAGVARGGLNLGGGPLTGYFIAKFTPSGTHTWSKALTASSTASIPRAVVDPRGDVVLAGSFSGPANLGGGPITSAALYDAFVVKYDSGGSFQWARQYGSAGPSNGNSATAVAVDACGNVFVTGEFFGSADFKPGLLTATDASKRYVFLAKLDPAGHGVWAKQFEATSTTNTGVYFDPRSIAVDSAGRPTITAGLSADTGQGRVDFGGGEITSIGDGVTVIAGFDAAGKHRWSYAPGGSAPPGSGFQSLATSPSMNALVGNFGKCATTCATSPPGTTAEFQGKALTAVSARDLFVWTFTP